MQRKRVTRQKQMHLCILVNKKSARYNPKYIKKLIGAIRKQGGYYSVFEPDSEQGLYFTAMKCVGLKRWHRSIPQNFTRRGKVTGLIACGGNSTANTVGRVAMTAGIPFGVLPSGETNDIAHGFYNTIDPDRIIPQLVSRKYQQFDIGKAGKYYFFSSVGVGFLPSLMNLLEKEGRPKFAFGWQRLGGKAIQKIKAPETVIKIDAFRFEAAPSLLNIHLLPYAAGIAFSPLSQPDDNTAEIIFNVKSDENEIGPYLKQLVKKKYIYGEEIKLFRGTRISLESIQFKEVVIDGDIKKVDFDQLDIIVQEKKLKVFCS